MKSSPTLLACAFALGASGCYLSFELEEGGARDGGPALDGAPVDAGRDAANLDGGPCFTARGVEICNTEECPPPSFFVDGGDGGCWSCRLPSPDALDQPGVCIQPGPLVIGFRGGDGVSTCTRGDAMLYRATERGHTCAHPLACLEVQDAGWGQCFYSDGTEVRTASLAPAGDCRGIDDLACGPGCRTCPEGQDCLGPSEASGLGYCVPLRGDDIFFDRDWCGFRTRTEERRECGDGQACLRFVTTPSPDFPDDEIVGECFRRSDCERLAAARPDRFRCE